MQLGFDTIGNATVIAYDRRPVLATDPWVLRSTIEFDSIAWRMARRAYGLLRFQYR